MPLLPLPVYPGPGGPSSLGGSLYGVVAGYNSGTLDPVLTYYYNTLAAPAVNFLMSPNIL